MKLKEAFEAEIERQSQQIAEQSDKLDIPSYEGDSQDDIQDGYPF